MINFLIAADHAGFNLKLKIISYLNQQRIPVTDLGAYNDDSVDYPDFAKLLCTKLPDNPFHFGILICGTGIGMSIAANRFKHIRAAVCNDGEQSAILSRAHNNANVLCLGARLMNEDIAIKIVDTFIQTPFEGGRHQTRLDKL